MAYLATLDRDAFHQAPEPEVLFPPRATFTPLEWRVIELAAQDGVASLAAPGRLRGIVRRLFGMRIARPLADPRLEQLRRAAVRCWRTGAAVEQAQVEALLGAGFSLPQVALLSRYIGDNR